MKNKVIGLCAWIGILGMVASTDAALIATANFNPNLNGSGDLTVGNKIEIGVAPITINALGVQDTGGTDGLRAATDVAIWSADGGTLLAAATVPAGTGGTLLNDWRYVLLGSPLTLAANTQYVIGAISSNSDGGPENAGEGYPGSIYFGDTGVTIIDSRHHPGTSLTFPDELGQFGQDNAWVGRWGHGNATFIPEPSSFALLLFGSAAFGVLRRRKKS